MGRSTVKDLVYGFSNSEKMKKYVHKKFSKYFKSEICEKVVLEKTYYSSIMKKCNVNGFFICSEEIRHYEKIIKIAASLFQSQELQKITNNKGCQQRLTELGVINE